MLLGDRLFPSVESSNKKDGRTEAADVAMRILMAEGAYKAANEMPSPVCNCQLYYYIVNCIVCITIKLEHWQPGCWCEIYF